MMRALSCLMLAAVLAAAPLALTAAPAAAKSATKVCKHKTASGKIKTWRCGVHQPCCVAEMINYYTCGSKLLGCL